MNIKKHSTLIFLHKYPLNYYFKETGNKKLRWRREERIIEETLIMVYWGKWRTVYTFASWLGEGR